MTNNHCPDIPAAPIQSRANEVALHDFAEKIRDQIQEFTETYAMEQGIAINPSILHNWMDCTHCESEVASVHHQVVEKMNSELIDFLEANI